MPRFRTQEWNGYQLRLLPHESVRYVFGDNPVHFLSDLIPYFYGPISFDLQIWAPKNRLPLDAELKYEWRLSRDKQDSKRSDEKTEGNGITSFISTTPLPFIKEHAKAGNTYHSNVHDPRQFKLFRKIQAVDLDVSHVDAYKLTMRFASATGGWSDFMVMAQFTVYDYDKARLGCLLALVGLAGTIAGGAVGYWIARILEH